MNVTNNNKFCNGCKKVVSKATHLCNTTGEFVKQNCLRCQKVHQNAYGAIRCKDCNRLFVSDECFSNHKQAGKNGGKSLCQKVFQCKKCDAMCHKQITEEYFNSIKERLKIKFVFRNNFRTINILYSL